MLKIVIKKFCVFLLFVFSFFGDDDEFSIVVVRMLKFENKEWVECLDLVLVEDIF